MEIIIKKRNVHSKILFEKIDEHVKASISLLHMLAAMEDISSLIEMFLLDEAEDYKLEQINVICDGRNNNPNDVMKGKTIIDIFYKHINCFNLTHLIYTIQR